MHQLPDNFRTAERMTVAVVGAGGNGSMLLPHLARIHKSLIALGRPDVFDVTVFDHDAVAESNLGRQAYSHADLGLNKAVIAVHRINTFFGLDWDATPFAFNANGWFDLVISCVDNLAIRQRLAEHDWKRRYWLDLGNTNTTGQVVLGGCGLPTLFDLHPELRTAKEDASAPSCSVAEALARQDLFINSTLANFAGQLLWKLFRTGELQHHGFYINLAAGRVTPIPVPLHAEPSLPSPRLPQQQPVGVRRRRARSRARAVR